LSKDLGDLKKLNVRLRWQDEPRDFTPWLAKDENIKILGDSLGIELEVENTEVSVGLYFADILAKDTVTGRYVVIENQLGKTNHDHLGKAITYASVLDATAIVWIAPEFTEEHKKALDWLNDHTDEDVSFYGVSLELWQIDESKPAVKFNVVSGPAPILRQAKKYKGTEEISDVRKAQLDFWTQFREKLLTTKQVPSAQSPRPQYWYDVSLGRSGIFLSNVFNTSENRLGIRVYLSNQVADIALPELEHQKSEIEKEIGEPLEWNPFPDKRDKVIRLMREADISKREQWGEYLDWLVAVTLKFRNTFSPRVKGLKLGSQGVGEKLAVTADNSSNNNDIH
jgi:hypothetical protein